MHIIMIGYGGMAWSYALSTPEGTIRYINVKQVIMDLTIDNVGFAFEHMSRQGTPHPQCMPDEYIKNKMVSSLQKLLLLEHTERYYAK